MEPDRAPQRVFAVVNPKSQRFHDVRAALRRACRAAGWPAPEFLVTTVARPGGPQAREALDAGAELVIAAGGDGTVREVAHVLAGSGTDLGIVSIGTANLVAHNLGVRTRNVDRAVARALSGPTRTIDIGTATWRPVVDGTPGALVEPQTFLVLAGLGNDAATVLGTRPEFKDRIGWLAYLASGVRHLTTRPVRMRVSIDGGPIRSLDTWSLLAANFGRIPGGITVFPAASATDGVLDTLEVPLESVWQWAGVAVKGLTGHRREVAALRYGTARSVWAVPDAPMPLHLDGDVVGSVTDVQLGIVPGALRVRAPEEP